MNYTIDYYSADVEEDIMALPDTLQARYITLTEKMRFHGPNLGEPYTKPFGGGLFELRLKGVEGIARIFYCTLMERRIVILHSFIKKSQKTPLNDRRIAETRMKQIRNES